MAPAGLFFALALLAGAAPALAVTTWLGGSSLLQPLVNNLVSNYNLRHPRSSQLPTAYSSTNSQDGVLGFKAGNYHIGVSAVPFTSAQEANFAKFTIPTAILSISFFTQKGGGIKLTPAQIAHIFLGQITRWGQIPGSGLFGTITPVVRSDAAGATLVYTQFLRAAVGGLWPSNYVGEGPFRYPNPNTVYVKGAANLAATTRSAYGTFGHAQTGVGAYAYGLAEIAVKNQAGIFVSLTGVAGSQRGNYLQALPRQPPSPSASWAGVNLNWGRGAATYPILTLSYFFYKKSYPPGAGAIIKAFGLFTQSATGQSAAQKYFFYPLSSLYTKNGIAAINTIHT